jgi:hypothetical protein
LLLAIVLGTCVSSCGGGSTNSLAPVTVLELPDTTTFWYPATYNEYDEVAGWCRECVPYLQVTPSGRVDLAGSKVYWVWPRGGGFPNPPGDPKGWYQMSINASGETPILPTEGLILTGDLSGVNWTTVDPAYGVVADTLPIPVLQSYHFTALAHDDSLLTVVGTAVMKTSLQLDTLKVYETLVRAR